MRAGIFVGGRATRMGGIAKGLLVAPSGETIVARWRRLFGQVGLPVVLVGARPEYADLGLPLIDDDPPGVGPVGGLVALLREGPAVVVACDMPFVTDALLRRLVAAPVQAPIVAPRRDGRWEPLFARYDVSVLPFARSRIAHGQLGLQGLLDEGGAAELPMEANEWAELADWDTLPP